MNMADLGIMSIGIHIPDDPNDTIDNIEQAASFGKDEAFVRTKLGPITLPRKPHGAETSDLAAAAVEALLAKSELARDAIGALFLVTQNPDGAGLPHTAAIVQQKLELSTDAACLDISLGCSGYVYGLHALRGFMDSAGITNGVLVTADPYSKIIDPSDRVTSLLFGDAATASWIGPDPVWRIGAARFGTDGAGAHSLQVCDGRLQMNGRAVFDFAALRIPKAIKALLAAEDLEPSDIDAFLVHQGSAAIVDTIARRFGNARERFVKDILYTGNTISSSIPILLDRHDSPEWKRILASGFGVGLSWGSVLLERAKNSPATERNA